jgi:UDPglucose 6-dehydrogenase
MINIGIIGFGFVGRAIAHGFSLHAKVRVYDKYNDIYDNIESTVNCSDFIFVSVPTPMREDGSQDISNLEDAIVNIVKVLKGNKIVIIKSTIIPGTTRKLAERFPQLSFVFSPEFLTQRTADIDFINPARIILGGEKEGR